MTTASVKFESVWKRLQRRPQVSTLAELAYGLPRRLMTRRDEDGLLPHEFWAVRDLSFELVPGEALGIIGPNGAGKSSILKLIFRIFCPDRGGVSVGGRVTGLIELGAGFHPMLSGRENVFINGSVLGLKQREIRRCYDAIVDFAELHEFMEMPVKNFSSGMYARLAFSIAVHAKPDVLLVDEVLAVGDAPFQAKCYDWIRRVQTQGCIIVMVSHQMPVIRLASRCIFLEHGQQLASGSPDDAIAAYERAHPPTITDPGLDVAAALSHSREGGPSGS